MTCKDITYAKAEDYSTLTSIFLNNTFLLETIEIKALEGLIFILRSWLSSLLSKLLLIPLNMY